MEFRLSLNIELVPPKPMLMFVGHIGVKADKKIMTDRSAHSYCSGGEMLKYLGITIK